MNRTVGFLKHAFLCSLVLFTYFGTHDLVAQDSRKVLAFYAFGDTMLNLLLEQSAAQGASPAKLQGLRLGIERELENSPIEVTLHSDGTLTILSGGNTTEAVYKTQGNSLMVQNAQTKEYKEFGYFTRNKAVLVINNSLFLDRQALP
jgi:hypothetical protein